MMWTGSEDDIAAAYDEESSGTSEDEGDIQVEILEKQRDEANEKLSELEQVSIQLLREVDALETQFQVERTCRESAEALAVKVTIENKILKRRSQMLMPLIPELPEDMANLTLDLGADFEGGDPGSEEEDCSEEDLLPGQAQINGTFCFYHRDVTDISAQTRSHDRVAYMVYMRKDGTNNTDTNKPLVPLVDMKSKAVDEMMDRIKKGIVLRPIVRPQLGPEEEMSWRDQRSEKRKSAVLELKGMLGNVKCQARRRASSRKRFSRNVGEAELQLVLQRRRRAMGEAQDKDTMGPSAKTQDPQPGSPAAEAHPWARKNDTVLMRLQQNREKRDSRIRASVLMINQDN
ncbi:shootin-1 [Osmerus eperlanus]|uniref:shootin-1 n=1 Tax=Osmerus eperlanus TaxID=29151 RepID=UPI002E0FF4E3